MARETWVQSQVESYQRLEKMVLDASLLNTQHFKVRIKGKVEPSREGVAPSPTSWCSSYRKGSLRVTLDYGRQLYLLYLLYGPSEQQSPQFCKFSFILLLIIIGSGRLAEIWWFVCISIIVTIIISEFSYER